MAAVFSIKRFKLDKRVTWFQRIRALISGWPQACNGKQVTDLQSNYEILPEWTEEQKEVPRG